MTLLCDTEGSGGQATSGSPHRAAIVSAWREAEAVRVAKLQNEMTWTREFSDSVHALAQRLAEGQRRHRPLFSVDTLLREFPLSGSAGMALMGLAESVLRIPDGASIDRLIADRLARGDWVADKNAGALPGIGLIVDCLRLCQRLLHTTSAMEPEIEPAQLRLLRTAARSAVLAAMRFLGGRFVIAADIGEALARCRSAERRGYCHSYDMLGEAAQGEDDARAYLEAYFRAIEVVGKAHAGRGVIAAAGVSVKLSALHPRFEFAQRSRVMAELLPRLRMLADRAARFDIGLCVDAEESERLDLTLDLIEALAEGGSRRIWRGLGVAVQAYQKRALAVIDFLIEMVRAGGQHLSIRLVKGAYWDGEIKRTQVDGLPDYPVFTRRAHTDISYLACARKMLAHRDVVYPQFASHNARTVASVYHLAGGADGDGYEFQCLFGMGEALHDQVVSRRGLNRRCRIYVPVGDRRELLPYLIRRLIENGAASSFLGLSADRRTGIDALVADPLDDVRRHGGSMHPRIPLPSALYGAARRNSAGIDLGDVREQARMLAAIAACRLDPPKAESLVAATIDAGLAHDIFNPADASDRVGRVVDATEGDVDRAIAAASAAMVAWSATPAERRAAILEQAAELMLADGPRLIALCLREAGKTQAACVAELREAADYCRYYAAAARGIGDGADHRPLGRVACISPWNFPLAIFTGQVAAALAAGNVVLAKPAEQTALTAFAATQLLHRAGVPRDVLQALCGNGESVGARLVADRRIDGVLFTGSHAVARGIQRVLAERGNGALVAETGGVNCMIVDSTALPEQVVSDVLRSAFDCAGQRCSSLRVLCLQEEIADELIKRLNGAMAELKVGDPAAIDCDVGPIIEAGAAGAIRAYVDACKEKCRVFRTPVPAGLPPGNYVAPALIEIDSLRQVPGEVFGPVLHVLRYRSIELERLLAEINAMGYGLTLGIQSRIDATIDRIVARSRVGNVYVNRNMIGAVVGVQPFGGEGLSGTGPKAGGPLYLHRLMQATPGPRWGAEAGDEGDGDAIGSELRRLGEWLLADRSLDMTSEERADVARLWRHYGARRYRSPGQRLPGPAGEDNRLYLAPRGILGGDPQSTADALNQIGAAIATGNHLLWPDEERWRHLQCLLPPPLRDRAGFGDADDAAVAAWLMDGQQADELAIVARCVALARRPGRIVPLIVGRPEFDLWRLLVERTVSINTAAVGGVVELLVD